MILFFHLLSAVLEWAYTIVFVLMVHAFLPLRQNKILRIAAVFFGHLLFSAGFFFKVFCGGLGGGVGL